MPYPIFVSPFQGIASNIRFQFLFSKTKSHVVTAVFNLKKGVTLIRATPQLCIMHYELCIKPSASLLFYNWSYALTVVAKVAAPIANTTMEVKVKCVIVFIFAMCRTPIVTAFSCATE